MGGTAQWARVGGRAGCSVERGSAPAAAAVEGRGISAKAAVAA